MIKKEQQVITVQNKIEPDTIQNKNTGIER